MRTIVIVMIASVAGKLERIDPDTARAIIELPGTGISLDVMLPRTLAGELADRIGQRITLHTLTQLEASQQGSHLTPRLFGFSSATDRRFFELFITVRGVGARKALRAMAIPVPHIALAIAERDAVSLVQLPEIGKRLAETIIATLRGKVESFITDETIEAKPGASHLVRSGPAAEAVAALVRLGETRTDAERMVSLAIEQDESLDSADAILGAAFGKRHT